MQTFSLIKYLIIEILTCILLKFIVIIIIIIIISRPKHLVVHQCLTDAYLNAAQMRCSPRDVPSQCSNDVSAVDKQTVRVRSLRHNRTKFIRTGMDLDCDGQRQWSFVV